MLIFLLTMSSRKLILFIVLPLTRACRIFFLYLKFHKFIYIFMLMYCSQSKILCQLIFCIVIFDIIWYFWSLKYCCLERDMRALHFSMVREFVVFFLNVDKCFIIERKDNQLVPVITFFSMLTYVLEQSMKERTQKSSIYS